jgi:hypothetical protein
MIYINGGDKLSPPKSSIIIIISWNIHYQPFDSGHNSILNHKN